MDFDSPYKSPYLVTKGFRALESLGNALTRVQVLIESGPDILDKSRSCFKP